MFRILAILLIFFCTGCDHQKAELQEVPVVSYMKIREIPLTLTTDLPGRVSAFSLSEVRPQVDGIILERLFEEGSEVQKGQTLYKIDSDLYRAERNAAQAALDEAKAKAELFMRQETRHRNLAHAKAVSQQDLDNTIAENRQAKARVARANAELERAEINLKHTDVKAHASGRIGISSVSPGALVTANQEHPLAVIQQIDNVYVDIAKSSADILRLRQALAQCDIEAGPLCAQIRLTLENGSPYMRQKPDSNGKQQPIYGEMLFSDISVGQDTGSVTLRAIFDNPERMLLPGMYVTATLEEGVMEKAILVPQRSVISIGSGKHAVFVLRPEQEKDGFVLEKREIKLDRPYENAWLVASGLKSGELVLVKGLQRAKADEFVKGFEDKNPLPTVSAYNQIDGKE